VHCVVRCTSSRIHCSKSVRRQRCSGAILAEVESFTLMDIQLQKADAKPVVSAFHGGWTEADKAALPID
jgi:hypothetical protein